MNKRRSAVGGPVHSPMGPSLCRVRKRKQNRTKKPTKPKHTQTSKSHRRHGEKLTRPAQWEIMTCALSKGLVWRETKKQQNTNRKHHRHTPTCERSNTTLSGNQGSHTARSPEITQSQPYRHEKLTCFFVRARCLSAGLRS